MFNFSIKQLLRQPGKALLFFLLMAASAALVASGAVLTIENNERIRIVDETYSTVGFVEQPAVSTESVPVPNACGGVNFVTTTEYGEYLSPDILKFPGVDYVVEPEYRPYYIFYEPKFSQFGDKSYFHILEFTPLEPVGDDGAPVEVEITKVLFSVDSKSTNSNVTISDVALHKGDHITVCQCWAC